MNSQSRLSSQPGNDLSFIAAQHLKAGDRVMLMSNAFNPALVAC